MLRREGNNVMGVSKISRRVRKKNVKVRKKKKRRGVRGIELSGNSR